MKFFKNKIFYLLILTILVVAVNAAKKKLTPEQQAIKNKMKAERKKKSEEADKNILHTSINEFNETIMTDTQHLWVVFYGSKNCPFTQKFNPKWLEFQTKLWAGEIPGLQDVKITKMECTGAQFKFCVKQNNKFWPELMLYYKGEKRDVYDGEDEIDDVIVYLQEKRKEIIDGPIGSSKKILKKPTTKIPPNLRSKPAKALPTKAAKAIPNRIKSTKAPPKKVTMEDDEDKQIKAEVENNKLNNINGKKTADTKHIPGGAAKGKEENEEDDKNGVNMYLNDDDDKTNEEDGEKPDEEIDQDMMDDDDTTNGKDSKNNKDTNEYMEYVEESNKLNEEMSAQNQSGSSHVVMFSVGGLVLGAIGLIYYRGHKKSTAYAPVNSGIGGYRVSQMKYKYNKQDKFIV